MIHTYILGDVFIHTLWWFNHCNIKTTEFPPPFCSLHSLKGADAGNGIRVFVPDVGMFIASLTIWLVCRNIVQKPVAEEAAQCNPEFENEESVSLSLGLFLLWLRGLHRLWQWTVRRARASCPAMLGGCFAHLVWSSRMRILTHNRPRGNKSADARAALWRRINPKGLGLTWCLITIRP